MTSCLCRHFQHKLAIYFKLFRKTKASRRFKLSKIYTKNFFFKNTSPTHHVGFCLRYNTYYFSFLFISISTYCCDISNYGRTGYGGHYNRQKFIFKGLKVRGRYLKITIQSITDLMIVINSKKFIKFELKKTKTVA